MFNNISREEVMNIIAADYPELLAIANLLYHDPGVIHYRWEDGTWRKTHMQEGVNQGCPLSSLFATRVLLRVLRLLNCLRTASPFSKTWRIMTRDWRRRS